MVNRGTSGTVINTSTWMNRLSQSFPASYTVWTDGVTCRAESNTAGGTDYSDTDANAATVINNAMAALTGSRTWKEKVVVRGNYSVGTTLTIPSYTILEIQGEIQLTAGVNASLIKNSDQTGGNSDIEIVGGRLQGNSANETAGNCIDWVKVNDGRIIDVEVEAAKEYGIYLNTCARNEIAFCNVHNNTKIGILLIADSDRNQVHDNIVYDNTQSGICIHTSSFNTVNDNTSVSNDEAGIVSFCSAAKDAAGNIFDSNILESNLNEGLKLYADGGNKVGQNVISNNLIRTNSWHGITLGGSVSGATHYYCYNTTITGNNIQYNSQCGIMLDPVRGATITGNMIGNNGQGAGGAATQEGIYIQNDPASASGCERITIVGNRIFDIQGTATQTYGIVSTQASDYIFIYDNDIAGNLSGTIVLVGTNNKVRNNTGYITENSGTSTGTGAEETIAHGCSAIPTKITITPTVTGAAITNLYQEAAQNHFHVTVTNLKTYNWKAEV
jgi:parallel beta-helix repeat protein